MQSSRLRNPTNLNEEEKNKISNDFSVVITICKHLFDAFYNFGLATKTDFGMKSNDEWRKIKKEIEAELTEASRLLKDELADLLNVEDIVESLNADIRQFTRDVWRLRMN